MGLDLPPPYPSVADETGSSDGVQAQRKGLRSLPTWADAKIEDAPRPVGPAAPELAAADTLFPKEKGISSEKLGGRG